MDHDDDIKVRDLRRAHDHAQDVELSLRRVLGIESPEVKAAEEVVRLAGAALERRHAELDQPQPDMEASITDTVMEHIGSGNFTKDLKTLNSNLQISDNQIGMGHNQVRTEANGVRFVTTVQTKQE